MHVNNELPKHRRCSPSHMHDQVKWGTCVCVLSTLPKGTNSLKTQVGFESATLGWQVECYLERIRGDILYMYCLVTLAYIYTYAVVNKTWYLIHSFKRGLHKSLWPIINVEKNSFLSILIFFFLHPNMLSFHSGPTTDNEMNTITSCVYLYKWLYCAIILK